LMCTRLERAAYPRMEHLVICIGSVPLVIPIFDNLVDVVSLVYIKHIYSAAVLLQTEWQ
jgi:hypothetical protein